MTLEFLIALFYLVASIRAGDLFDPETASRLHQFIYSVGGARDFKEAYRLFRGRDLEVGPLLAGRGLVKH
jgi:peptidyl-dipeptidase Dcp